MRRLRGARAGVRANPLPVELGEGKEKEGKEEEKKKRPPTANLLPSTFPAPRT